MKNQNTALSGRNTMLSWLLAVNIVNSHAATDTADIGSDALPMGDAPASISSPTRLQQFLLDVPGSTTVVTNDMFWAWPCYRPIAATFGPATTVRISSFLGASMFNLESSQALMVDFVISLH